MLAIELIERMITNEIKVICIDLTKQYASELSDFHDCSKRGECLKKIQEAGEKDKEAIAENSETAGALDTCVRQFTMT